MLSFQIYGFFKITSQIDRYWVVMQNFVQYQETKKLKNIEHVSYFPDIIMI